MTGRREQFERDGEMIGGEQAHHLLTVDRVGPFGQQMEVMAPFGE
jgi:hypothetical protein